MDPAGLESGLGFAWGTYLLPQLDLANLYEALDLNLDAVDADNLATANVVLEVFHARQIWLQKISHCPAVQNFQPPTMWASLAMAACQ